MGRGGLQEVLVSLVVQCPGEFPQKHSSRPVMLAFPSAMRQVARRSIFAKMLGRHRRSAVLVYRSYSLGYVRNILDIARLASDARPLLHVSLCDWKMMFADRFLQRCLIGINVSRCLCTDHVPSAMFAIF